MTFEEILTHFDGAKQRGGEYVADCPACGKREHLYLSCDKYGKVLLHCKKGCTFDEVVSASGLQKRDFFREERKGSTWIELRSHIYCGADGCTFAKKTIYDTGGGKKTAVWFRFEGGQFAKGLEGKKPPLYHFDKLLRTEAGDVYITEGEKDVETVEGFGYVATTAPNGAGARWPQSFNQYFKGRTVFVLGDNDEAGRKHMRGVVASLHSSGVQAYAINAVDIYPEALEKWDISDIVKALGASEAKALLEKAVDVAKSKPVDVPAICEQAPVNEIRSGLKFALNGSPLPSIENFLEVLQRDEQFSNIRFNLLTNSAEIQGADGVRSWNDTDDSATRCYIQSKYDGLYAPSALLDAFKLLLRKREYHPIRDIIDNTRWDGVSRVNTLLSKWLCCEDTSYTREVSRLIFAGGINRLYHPGCKFDEVPILIGTSQGEGKSTFVRWLAMNDSFFKEVGDIEGARGVEAIQGAWVCELSELLALTKAREVEAVKSYLTRLEDCYRVPYDKNVSHLKRQCIFIGTTNKRQFLTDKTGNRRFYPVAVHQTASKLFEHEAECRADILQAWAEARAKLNTDEMRPYAATSLYSTIRAQQADAVEDDYRVGMIENYLADKQRCCVFELWQKALNNPFTKPTRAESNEIALIMQGLFGWEHSDKPEYTNEYGRQRVWVKKYLW